MPLHTNKYNTLIEKQITIDNKSAIYYQSSNMDNDKPIAHFFGGNGFATGVYTPLFHELSKQFNMVSLSMRGCWHDKPHAKKLTREEDADILIQFLENTQSAPIIGIGHSQGATSTAIACARRPDLFSTLYLIEPVTFTRKQVKIYNLLPRWVLKRNEPFKSTIKKQSIWQSIEEYYQFLRQKKLFKRLSDEHLFLYAKYSLKSHNLGFELIFSPEQELANYFGVPFIDDALITINKTEVPYHLIIGKPSIFISDAVRKEWMNFITSDLIIHEEYGHLLPVEAPKLCADNIFDIHLNSVSKPFVYYS